MLIITARRLIPQPARIQAILLTSANAIPALLPSATPLFAVGDATADAACAAGFAQVHSADGDAHALAALATRSLRPNAGPVLLACGAGEGQALTATLRQAGFTVHRRIAYAATSPTTFPANAAAAIATGQLRAAIFLSTATAENFVRLCPHELHAKLAAITALAIGNRAADALKPLPWGGLRAARHPTLNEVLALL